MHRAEIPPRVPPVRRSASAGFVALAGLVITASFVVRLVLLDRQSYWIDEIFSVHESAGSLGRLATIGSTEVHPPLYAALLWAWVRAGGTHTAWTRLSSALCAGAAVVVAHRGLRDVRLADPVRWALTTATAASGTSIAYSLETRSYALVLLGSVGLTAATVRAAVAALDGGRVDRRARLAWTGWSLLAATTHLFGALLTVGAVAVLVAVTLGTAAPGRWRGALAWVAIGAAGCLPQAAWLLWGSGRPGFAAGTRWIAAPDARDVADLLTTTFGAGGLSARTDGVAWTSPLGPVAALALCGAAALAGAVARARGRPGPARTIEGRAAEGRAAEGRAAGVLLALAVLVTGGVYAVSQRTHLWTLRNLIVVSPALLWGVICLAAAAAGTAVACRAVAVAAVALAGAGLAPTATGLARPYKTDFRGLYDYLVAVRSQQPDVRIVFVGAGPPPGWEAASDRADDDPARAGLAPPGGRGIVVTPVRSLAAVVRTPGPDVVVLYPGAAPVHVDRQVSALIGRLRPVPCRSVPLHGLGVVRCD